MVQDRILVVDDEEDILDLVRINFVKEGYDVICTESAEHMLEIVKVRPIDLIVLDLMLPGADGLSVTKYLKSDTRFNSIPIVMLTAKGDERDIVAGLDAGAADYVTKPFSPRILVARVRAVLRCNGNMKYHVDSVLQRDDLTIDKRKHLVLVEEQPVRLTLTEFEILTFLASRPGWTFSRTQIVDVIRGFGYSVTDRCVDVHIVGLRRKLGLCSDYIETVRGVGYRFRDHR